jgi:hypothetical protein
MTTSTFRPEAMSAIEVQVSTSTLPPTLVATLVKSVDGRRRQSKQRDSGRPV